MWSSDVAVGSTHVRPCQRNCPCLTLTLRTDWRWKSFIYGAGKAVGFMIGLQKSGASLILTASFDCFIYSQQTAEYQCPAPSHTLMMYWQQVPLRRRATGLIYASQLSQWCTFRVHPMETIHQLLHAFHFDLQFFQENGSNWDLFHLVVAVFLLIVLYGNYLNINRTISSVCQVLIIIFPNADLDPVLLFNS